MTAIVIIIPTWRRVEERLGENPDLREQYQREWDALFRAMQEPQPRTRPIALPRERSQQ